MMLSADDRLAILDLIARYSHYFDFGPAETFADTFTDDGVFEFVTRQTVRGRAALTEMAAGAVARRGVQRHITTNPVIDGDGDEATVSLHLLVIQLDGAERRPAFTGRYDDRLKRVNGRWKFVHRRLTPDTA